MEFRCGDFQRRLRKPVSDTVRARDLQREGTNKEMGNAVSQRNFLNYTRHSFPSLFNPYFLHLKIFQKSAKTNALLGRDIWFYWFHRSFRWKFVVFVSKREKKKKRNSMEEKRRKRYKVERVKQLVIRSSVSYYFSGRFSRISL